MDAVSVGCTGLRTPSVEVAALVSVGLVAPGRLAGLALWPGFVVLVLGVVEEARCCASCPGHGGFL